MSEKRLDQNLQIELLEQVNLHKRYLEDMYAWMTNDDEDNRRHAIQTLTSLVFNGHHKNDFKELVIKVANHFGYAHYEDELLGIKFHEEE